MPGLPAEAPRSVHGVHHRGRREQAARSNTSVKGADADVAQVFFSNCGSVYGMSGLMTRMADVGTAECARTPGARRWNVLGRVLRFASGNADQLGALERKPTIHGHADERGEAPSRRCVAHVHSARLPHRPSGAPPLDAQHHQAQADETMTVTTLMAANQYSRFAEALHRMALSANA